jgi:dihydroorotate dehydrogenase electron transfer subunit
MTDHSCHAGKIQDFKCTVTSSEALSERIGWFTVRCPELAERISPGTSVMVFTSEGNDPLLGRPFAVADVDLGRGELSVCYMVTGRGTEMMLRMDPGREVRLRGPFGIPLPAESGKVIIAAGGAGIATFIHYAKKYPDSVAGVYLGIPGKGYEKFAAKVSGLLPGIRIFTDDGSFGEGGEYVPCPAERTRRGRAGMVMRTIGFLKALRRYYDQEQDKLYFSLDKRMACGYGGCMGCVVETSGGLKRICADQSLFRADEVTEDEY